MGARVALEVDLSCYSFLGRTDVILQNLFPNLADFIGGACDD